MEGQKSNFLLRRLSNSLTLPYSLLIVAVIVVFVLLFFSASRLNSYSVQSSQHLFSTALRNEISSVANITKDYSYWNDAVEKLILKPDEDFIAENLLGTYLEDTFDITRVIVLNAEGELLLSVNSGVAEKPVTRDLTGSEIQALVNEARATDMQDPTPATGMLWINEDIYIVTVGAITPSAPSKLMDMDKAYGFLILARRLDTELLEEISSLYQLQQMQLHTAPGPLPDQHVMYPIESPLKRWVANISWFPERAGDRFIDDVLPWVIGLFAMMLIISTLFFVRVKRYSQLMTATLLEIQDSRQQLNTLAYFDAVTGLPNRSLAMDRLQQAIAASRRMGVLTAVLYIDLDGFKQLNDTRGHDAGDQLLRMVGQRMQKCIREEDTAARMGGDEFCIILVDLAHIQAAEIIASKLQDAMALPFIINGNEVFISASIGIIIAPTDGTDPTQLLQHADIAMYQAKHKGRNCYQYFTTELNDRIQHQADLQLQLRNAQQNDEFSLVYQPICRVGDSGVAGAEVLIRWNNDKLGEVPPSEFIPLAEDSGMIVPIGEWVLRKCLDDARQFYNHYGRDFFISINISGRQLSDRYLVELLSALYSQNADRLPTIHLEITEGYLIQNNSEASEILQELSALGVQISIDDFGTGYSSLSYLHQFPINTLKVDQSFIHQIKPDGKEACLVSAIITISKSLQLNVIAEGVETQAQLTFLQQQGCELVQGFYLAHPMPVKEFLQHHPRPPHEISHHS